MKNCRVNSLGIEECLFGAFKPLWQNGENKYENKAKKKRTPHARQSNGNHIERKLKEWW